MPKEFLFWQRARLLPACPSLLITIYLAPPKYSPPPMFFCIPIFFGCQTKLKPESNQAPQTCPRCHNASVFPAKKSTWFEFFFIPVIPLSSKHILMCTICGWQAAVVEQQQAPAGGGNSGTMTDKSIAHLRPAQGWETPNHPGYQPGYIHPPSGSHKQ